MVGAVGEDAFAAEALAGLEEAGVELELERVGETGVALIYVDDAGETEIVVAPGANRPRDAAAGRGRGALPARDPERGRARGGRGGVVRRAERGARRGRSSSSPTCSSSTGSSTRSSPRGRLVAVTFGAEGAALFEDGREVARAVPPPVTAVDGTAAGDAFTACLTVSLLEGRPRDEALRRACAAGALAASRPGAQPSLPTAAEVDAILAR